MEKIPFYKIEVYITDPNQYDYSLEDIKNNIDNSMTGVAISGDCNWGDCRKIKVKVENWDRSKWNNIKTSIGEYRKLFKK